MRTKGKERGIQEDSRVGMSVGHKRDPVEASPTEKGRESKGSKGNKLKLY